MEKISCCKYPDRCRTAPWRRQQNAVTSVAVTGGSDFGRNRIGRNAITSRTVVLRDSVVASNGWNAAQKLRFWPSSAYSFAVHAIVVTHQLQMIRTGTDRSLKAALCVTRTRSNIYLPCAN
jgi:hypothetical protein